MSDRSIHPNAVVWRPETMPLGTVGKTTAIGCRLGYIFKAASGLWQATRYPNFDCGEHKMQAKAKQAVENFDAIN